MIPGDIVPIYGNAEAMTQPQGLAKLIEKMDSEGEIELWKVEFIDHEGQIYNARIKNTQHGNQTFTGGSQEDDTPADPRR
jgi:hypothetical protein